MSAELAGAQTTGPKMGAETCLSCKLQKEFLEYGSECCRNLLKYVLYNPTVWCAAKRSGWAITWYAITDDFFEPVATQDFRHRGLPPTS
uniref:Uncharacterized protein n=1 Tax=Romanomermis culicivorax TaxID=13658 RepID=A0A915K8A2_ROMCU